jgi:arylsulfatase A-like enzyme
MAGDGRVTRRELGASAAAAAGVLASSGALASASAAKSAHQGRGPNILYIMADDLGSGDLGCYGHPEVQTPNLDRLAREGVRLSQMYTPGAVCSPTRVGWITGRYPGRVAAGNAEPLSSQHVESLGVSATDSTLPRLLKQSGYDTALFGKWHLGFPAVPGNEHPDYSPVLSGFDEFWGSLDGAVDYISHAATGPTPESFGLFAGDADTDAPGKVRPVEADGYLTDLIADKAIDYLERRERQDDPFYLGVHLSAPHWPWLDRDDKAESDRLNDPRIWNNGLSLLHYDGGTLETYYEMVRIMDENIGRILRQLESSGKADDTIVIFTSDNGGERFSYHWPFTGQKQMLQEGGIRVPCIVRWPGQIAPRTVSDLVATTMDLTASILALAGARPESPLDGKDVLPVLMGRALPVDRTVFWRHRGTFVRGEPHGAVRDGDLKYLRTPGGATEQLFDLAADPREQANLSALRPDDLARLRAAWLAWNSELVPYPA